MQLSISSILRFLQIRGFGKNSVRVISNTNLNPAEYLLGVTLLLLVLGVVILRKTPHQFSVSLSSISAGFIVMRGTNIEQRTLNLEIRIFAAN